MNLSYNWTAIFFDHSRRVMLRKPGTAKDRELCYHFDGRRIRRLDPKTGHTLTDPWNKLPPDAHAELLAACRARWPGASVTPKEPRQERQRPPASPWPPASRSTDPVSSHSAELEINSTGTRAQQCEYVLEVLRRFPGLTAKELTAKAGDPRLDRYTFNRRLPDLEKKGLAVRGPVRTCRVGGRLSTTWRAR